MGLFTNPSYYKYNLGWIIDKLKNLITQTGDLETAFEEFLSKYQNNLDQTVKDQLQEWVNDGTLAALIADQIQPYVNVTLYGVKGDGITDNTAAIENLINENPGKTLFFPCGIYLASQIVLKDNTHIRGENRDGAIIRQIYSSGNTDFIISPGAGTDSPTEIRNISFHDLTIDGDRVHGNSGIAVNIMCFGMIMENVFVVNGGSHGIHLTHSQSNSWGKKPTISVIDNVWVSYCGGIGIWNESLNDITFSNCYVSSNSQNLQFGFPNCKCEAGTKIIGCHFWNQNDNEGTVRSGNALEIANLCEIVGCHIEGGYPYCLSINGYGNQVSASYIYNTFGEYSLYINGSANNFSGVYVNGSAPDDVTYKKELVACAFLKGSSNRIDINGSTSPVLKIDDSTDLSMITVTCSSLYTAVIGKLNGNNEIHAYNQNFVYQREVGYPSGNPWQRGFVSTGATTLELPTPSQGQFCVIWNSGSNPCTITIDGGTINYASSYSLPANTGVMIMCLTAGGSCVRVGV